jgi:predicted amidophosphoribosyltransferase
MAFPKPRRSPWERFPDAVILAEERPVRSNAEYAAAKTGDVASAKRLAATFAKRASLDALAALVAGIDALIVPVHALEDQGINRIPSAFAELLAERLGLEVEAGIVQANVVNHTGASGWKRLASPAMFAGEAQAGRSYVIADDFIGQGGTIANLRGHLLAGGAIVLGATTLTGKSYSAKLRLDSATLAALRTKHGSELENWWTEAFGYGFDRLTESEARYLLRAENADSVRDRILEARSQAEP